MGTNVLSHNMVDTIEFSVKNCVGMVMGRESQNQQLFIAKHRPEVAHKDEKGGTVHYGTFSKDDYDKPRSPLSTQLWQ